MKFEQSQQQTVKLLRVMVTDQPGFLGRLTTCIGRAGGNIADIRLVKRGAKKNLRELEISVESEAHLEKILKQVGRLKGILIDRVSDPLFEAHLGGKIAMRSRVSIQNLADMRRIYTPGVAEVCRVIQRDPAKAWDYTALARTVAIATNGTAILGLGAIGNLAGLPVMEGKSVLFDRLAGLSGIPLLIKHRKPRPFIEALLSVAESFGAIQIEDVAAPECFEIEEEVSRRAGRPVLHDDQHGTAVVVLAALLNACRLTGVHLEQEKVGILGLGAAGSGIARLLRSHGVRQICGSDINPAAMRRFKRHGGQPLPLKKLMQNCRIVVMTTGVPNLVSPSWVQRRQVILSLSNPQPEILPELALKAGAGFAADGKGINNALAFPGLFKGALAAQARHFSREMLLAAAAMLAGLAENEELLPPILDEGVHEKVALAVERAALKAPGSPNHLFQKDAA